MACWPTIIIWGRAPGGRLPAPGRRARRPTRRPAGLGAGLLRAQGPRPLDFLERVPTPRAAQAGRAEPPLSAAHRQRAKSPNLASQALGAALRALPEQWQERFGYRPLLAESFTDPEAYAGTCYKASNWEPVGFSAGYSRHRADFYIPNDRPKKLWLLRLCPHAAPAARGGGARGLLAPALVAPPSGYAAGQGRSNWTPCWRCSATRPIRAHANTRYPHRPGAHAHRPGAAGRAAGDRRDRPLCHHLDPAPAPPPGPAAQEGHPRLLPSARLQRVLPSAHPHGPRSLRHALERLAAGPRPARLPASAGAGRQNDPRPHRPAHAGPARGRRPASRGGLRPERRHPALRTNRRRGPAGKAARAGRENHHRRPVALPAQPTPAPSWKRAATICSRSKATSPTSSNRRRRWTRCRTPPFSPHPTAATAASKCAACTPSPSNP